APAPTAGTKAPRPSPRAAASESAGELLVAAREQAGRGKLAAAAATYERLLDAYPRSSEAHAALVSLGRVQASRGRHAAALSAYSRYLDGGGGPLAEEAHFGRIGALDALGRGSDRDRAIEAFATAYPRSVYLGKARALGH
ncbi:MAG: tetratricopeptide repeat protein, partial [Nannocystaceae bacterium]|nr:tetratricopeptide repeat protein [Nannocystaceae bacterium]